MKKRAKKTKYYFIQNYQRVKNKYWVRWKYKFNKIILTIYIIVMMNLIFVYFLYTFLKVFMTFPINFRLFLRFINYFII